MSINITSDRPLGRTARIHATGHLDQIEANEMRLLAGDIVHRLRTHRNRAQLTILSIQIETAIREIDAFYARNAEINRTKQRRTQSEMSWKEKTTSHRP